MDVWYRIRVSRRPPCLFISKVRPEIQNLDNLDPTKLGIWLGNPEVLWEWLIRGNDVPVAENHGLSDCELLKYSRYSKSLDQYKCKDQIIQNTATVEFPDRYNSIDVDKKFREDCMRCMRNVNRLLESEIGANTWGNAETYDHTRNAGEAKNYIDKGKNASGGNISET